MSQKHYTDPESSVNEATHEKWLSQAAPPLRGPTNIYLLSPFATNMTKCICFTVKNLVDQYDGSGCLKKIHVYHGILFGNKKKWSSVTQAATRRGPENMLNARSQSKRAGRIFSPNFIQDRQIHRDRKQMVCCLGPRRKGLMAKQNEVSFLFSWKHSKIYSDGCITLRMYYKPRTNTI